MNLLVLRIKEKKTSKRDSKTPSVFLLLFKNVAGKKLDWLRNFESIKPVKNKGKEKKKKSLERVREVLERERRYYSMGDDV